MQTLGPVLGALGFMLLMSFVPHPTRRTLTALLTPVMILAMGGSVGFIVFAILKPILEMNTLIK